MFDNVHERCAHYVTNVVMCIGILHYTILYFKEDLGWFSVFMSIRFSFSQSQIGSQTYQMPTLKLLGCSLQNKSY